ncbi:B12-binding domain-containing radical SAM protein [Methanopyrus kandleri]|uniref:Fe-S oxidoreductase n=2 Tax=Methanopyrus kandleri TaxID=2320 RepID=Q8TWY6_METKA|nr:radical SAM protein [Methanopyrus kandleri]AAM02108.1 Fe-S oxidoreductase [Methanopyrus kandleri AV19]HII69877.1 B12-binding domain-containing radical SAM protein [Methanopyrus kandleri]
MKVLLVQPPFEDDIARVLGVRGFPIGLVYLAAKLEKEGFSVDILDCPAEGVEMEDLRGRIRGYDAVGITATTPVAPSAYKVAKLAKDEGAFVFLGGPHPTFMDREALRESPADVVIRGEGESTTVEVLEAVDRWEESDLSNIPGITYREGSKIVRNPDRQEPEDLDSLPLPAYDKVDLDQYSADSVRFVPVITSRGCPFRCLFCASSRIFGPKWRGKSPDRVVEEISYLVEELGVERLEFVDDVFTAHKRRVREICEKMREEGIDVPWDCGARADTLTPELARTIREHGCRTVYVGAESASNETLKRINKGITVQDVIACRKVAKRHGLRILLSFILGFPWEDREDVFRTIKFARRLEPDYVQFTVCTPYPGTPLYDLAKERGLIEVHDWSKYTTVDPVMRTEHLSTRELGRLLQRAYLSFYLNPRYLLNALREGKLFLFKRIVKSGIRAVLSYLSR